MTEFLPYALQLAGLGLITLAILHVPIGRHLDWRTDAARLTPVNEAIFHVHGFFICLALVAMGLPCLLDPIIFLEKSRAAMWGCWSLGGFWLARLYCQFFVYPATLWRGKRMEKFFHWFFAAIWLGLTTLFALCGSVQAGWLS
jgi:hypothetical protein